MKASMRKGRHFCLISYAKNHCVVSCVRTESGLRHRYRGSDLLGKEKIVHKTELTEVNHEMGTSMKQQYLSHPSLLYILKMELNEIN